MAKPKELKIKLPSPQNLFKDYVTISRADWNFLNSQIMEANKFLTSPAVNGEVHLFSTAVVDDLKYVQEKDLTPFFKALHGAFSTMKEKHFHKPQGEAIRDTFIEAIESQLDRKDISNAYLNKDNYYLRKKITELERRVEETIKKYEEEEMRMRTQCGWDTLIMDNTQLKLKLDAIEKLVNSPNEV